MTLKITDKQYGRLS